MDNRSSLVAEPRRHYGILAWGPRVLSLASTSARALRDRYLGRVLLTRLCQWQWSPQSGTQNFLRNHATSKVSRFLSWPMKSPSISEDYRASSSRVAIERTRRADIYTHTHRSKYSAQNSCVALAFIAALECQNDGSTQSSWTLTTNANGYCLGIHLTLKCQTTFAYLLCHMRIRKQSSKITFSESILHFLGCKRQACHASTESLKSAVSVFTQEKSEVQCKKCLTQTFCR